MEFFIISGMSGAGKSKAASFLEDMGYYCVDNMPSELIPRFAELCVATKGRFERVALVVDVRGGVDFNALFDALESLTNYDCTYKILFFEANTDTIIKRYKETRHRHPLAADGQSIEQTIEREHEMLSGVRARADYIINTTSLSSAQLRERLLELFSGAKRHDKSIVINVVSFGFKYGVPPESDLVFDVRFLPNPYYETELRTQTGKQKPVRDYVMKWRITGEFLELLYKLIDFLIPQYIEEGKTSLAISIGCTGGKHRSVVLAEEIRAYIERRGYKSAVFHRDCGRE
ncbi:MAG: RNase adapter RapZ [Clostridiales bacterium]|nr:RNase adapter RapZ [Clostridiales bacterium]